MTFDEAFDILIGHEGGQDGEGFDLVSLSTICLA